jgi:2-(3-amino-3-carboxypropyl)histidine synthase
MTARHPEESPPTTLLDPPSPPAVHVPASWVFPTLGPELFEAVRSGGHRRIALQVPAGLVRNAHELAGRIRQETGASVTLVARACFGACDFPSEGEVPGADALVVLGHSPIPNVRLTTPTYFVEMRHAGGDPDALAETLRAAGVPSRLGLVASVQHLDLLPRLSDALRSRGITLETGTGDHRLFYASQALGCNYTSAQSIASRVDGYLFVGTGRFHPLGLAYAVDKPVWSLDPLQNVLEPPIDRASLVRDRQILVARAMDARSFGILVSSFAGQNRSGMAAALAERARRAGRVAELLVTDRVDPRDLEGRNLDAYVCTACPRIALDDYRLYPKPMLTPPEFLMALGELPLEPYRFDTYH